MGGSSTCCDTCHGSCDGNKGNCDNCGDKPCQQICSGSSQSATGRKNKQGDTPQLGDDADAEAQGDGDDFLGLAGTLCRVRAAVTVAKSKDPSLLASFLKKKGVSKHESEIKGLLECLEDVSKSNVDCEGNLFGLMGAISDVMPVVKEMESTL